MQRNAMRDKRIISIGGVQVGGLLTVSETGIQEDPVEVPESGYIRLIGSGVKKIRQVELSYLVKRTSPTLKHFIDWFKDGGFARDVTMHYTDKSGNLQNAYRRDLFTDCELGNFLNPAFDEGGGEKAMLNISLFPYGYEARIL